MGRPAGLAAKRQDMFWRVPKSRFVAMMANGLGIMTRNAEVSNKNVDGGCY